MFRALFSLGRDRQNLQCAWYDGGSLSMNCLDDSRIVAFALGRLDPCERSAIRSHMESCPTCAALVAEATRGTDAEASAAEDEPTGATLETSRGTSVGRYLVLECIGEGGLGQVFTAYDPELDRQVAVKLIKPAALRGTDREQLSARLVREAQALARVQHPNVVAVHDAGSYDDGVFVAMELVKGTTLDGWLRASTRSWQAIRDVFLAAGQGLIAAHQAGLVHRDFKPSNVLIGVSGRVQVADFGLARAVAGTPAVVAHGELELPDLGGRMLDSITESGVLVGTPAYMAPEQLQGHEIGPAADQFSFCVALYEALLGVRPFGGHTVGARLQAIKAHQLQPVPNTPSEASVPKWLRRALLRGLQPDAQQRHASLAALLNALQHDRQQRRWRGASVIAGIVAATVAGWLGALAVGPSAEQADQVERLAGEAQAAAAAAHYVYPAVDDPSEATAYAKVVELEALEGAAEALADERAATLRTSLSTTLVGLGDRYWDREGGEVFATEYYVAAVMFDPNNRHARGRMRVTPVQLHSLAAKAAALDFTPGELAAAAPLAMLARSNDDDLAVTIDTLLEGSPPPSLTAAAALARLGGLGTISQPSAPGTADRREGHAADDAASANPASANTAVLPPARKPRRTVVAARPTAEHTDPGAANAEVKRGQAALNRADIPEAETAFHSALRHDRRNAAALAGLGEVYFQRGSLDKARRFLERAVARAPKISKYRLHLGDIYFKQLRYDDARAAYGKARTLGNSAADKRLQRIRDRIGE